MIPGFIPPVTWFPGSELKARKEEEKELNKRFVLSAIDHNNAIWNDRSFHGLFGDPFVRVLTTPTTVSTCRISAV